ncbi:MAG: hypothetical protein N3C63_05720 [Rhodocyclaceae bacterium]|nr:hypothetical protein [Rhodocyclaceae bacterium]
MKLIVSTCGTSLLTNLAGEQRSLVTRHANAKHAEDVPVDARQTLQALIDAARERMQAADASERAKLSAEYNGLVCYYGPRFAPEDQHWLIATDTWLGQATAGILAEVLGERAQVKRIPDLRTEDLPAFRLAMAALVRLCAEEIRPLGLPVVFNLTGGFKSVQGFMQALGMLYADETVYVFESSQELLRLPRLPIRLDAEATVRATLPLWRRLEAGLPVMADKARGIPEIFLLVLDGQVALSEWGELVWREVRDGLLSEQLWPPIDDKLRFGPDFERSTRECSADERRQINERIGELARHLHDPGFNPRRLDFKKLAQPHQGSTHECDAWAQGGAKRLFGHFEGGVFVLDRLARGLH